MIWTASGSGLMTSVAATGTNVRTIGTDEAKTGRFYTALFF